MDLTQEDEDIEVMKDFGKETDQSSVLETSRFRVKTMEVYKGMTAQELNGFAMTLLQDLETARLKSGKIQGKLNDVMKD